MNIYLDIDGCISNWYKGVCECCGVDFYSPSVRKELKDRKEFKKSEIGFSFVEQDKMWSNIEDAGIDFWINLDMFPWSKKLYDTLTEVGDVCFLTSPGNILKNPLGSSMAAAGKVIWVQKHFNTNNLLIGYNKSFCANKDSILIDDSYSKISEFKLKGGHTYYWPNCISLLDGDIDYNMEINKLVKYIKDRSNND